MHRCANSRMTQCPNAPMYRFANDQMTKFKLLVSWGSGKDSAWLVHVLRTTMPEYEIAAVLTTINESAGRVAMHAVRTELVEAQAREIGVPLWPVPIPSPCPNEVYEAAMRKVVARAVHEGFTTI